MSLRHPICGPIIRELTWCEHDRVRGSDKALEQDLLTLVAVKEIGRSEVTADTNVLYADLLVTQCAFVGPLSLPQKIATVNFK